MKIVFLTIVLDGMPWITCHLPTLNRLRVQWEWHIVEGVAAPTHCTTWCKKIEPRLSLDGTREYLDELSSHPRIHVHRKELWDGKIEMVNAPLASIHESCLLWQLDSDELWTPGQIETVHQLFRQHPEKNCAFFTCRYFVGQNIAVTGRGVYGNRDGEWLRVFRFEPGMEFEKHEPPRIKGLKRVPFEPKDTERMGLIFDHYAYATKAQAEFKEKYYGYTDAVAHWERLQRNEVWPAALKDFFPWVKDNTTVSPCL